MTEGVLESIGFVDVFDDADGVGDVVGEEPVRRPYFLFFSSNSTLSGRKVLELNQRHTHDRDIWAC